jgi:excisionase family DNA binding protein
MSINTEKLAYSITELAKVAGVGRSFLYEEVKAGRLKIKKAGRRSLVLIADAEAWLAALPDLYVSRSREYEAGK